MNHASTAPMKPSQTATSPETSAVLFTNNNVASMLAVGPAILKYPHAIRKIYVTRRLPGAKNNLSGAIKILLRSGIDYAWFKLWTNAIARHHLMNLGLPGTVSELVIGNNMDIPVEYTTDANAAWIADEVTKLNVNYIVSNSCSQRLRQHLLATARIGGVNLHSSPLPRYAGLSPYFWQLFFEESNYSVTLHKMTSTLDAGDVLGTHSGSTSGCGSVLDAFLRTAVSGSELWQSFFAGKLLYNRAVPQPKQLASYFGHPTAAQVQSLKRRGIPLLNRHSLEALTEAVKSLNKPSL